MLNSKSYHNQTNKNTQISNSDKIPHATMHVSTVNDNLEQISEKMEILKNTKDNIKTLVKNIEERADYDLDQVLGNLKNVFEQITMNFSEQILNQKQENDKLQQIIVDLKKEKTQIQQLIITCAKKCSELEQDLGKYPIEEEF